MCENNNIRTYTITNCKTSVPGAYQYFFVHFFLIPFIVFALLPLSLLVVLRSGVTLQALRPPSPSPLRRLVY